MSNIPEEIQMLILNYLPPSGFNRAWRTSRAWRKYLETRADYYVYHSIQLIGEYEIYGFLPNGMLHGWTKTRYNPIRKFKLNEFVEQWECDVLESGMLIFEVSDYEVYPKYLLHINKPGVTWENLGSQSIVLNHNELITIEY